MIIKNFEIKKIDYDLNNLILFYGKNDGLKKENINLIKIKQNIKTINSYDQNDILKNNQILFNEINNLSFFDEKKLIIINFATDKIIDLIEEITSNLIKDIIIILNSEILDTKSKLRKTFEKNSNLICVPFYPDDVKTLTYLAVNYLRERKISISQSDLNLIVNRCQNNRLYLLNELEKISHYTITNKITSKDVIKLTNLSENHDIYELIDFCLIKNAKKVGQILNENNFNNEDCIIIVRTFLSKTKKLLRLANNLQQNNNLEITISKAKPPIFWKEKDVIKLQLQKWKPNMLKKLISNISLIELEIKKNSQLSLNILMNFIFEQITSSV